MRQLSNWLLAVFAITLTACSPAERQEIQAPKYGVTEVEMTDVHTSHCQLTMGFESWEPYQYLSPGGEVGGVDFEIAQQAFSYMGCTLRVEQGSWMDLLELLQNGHIDFLMGASMTEGREQFAYFSLPYRNEQFSLFVRGERRNYFDQSTVEEFVASGYRVGIVNEYYYGEELQNLMYDSDYTNQFIGAMINELNVARVLDGEIDGFLEDNLVASSIIRRRGLTPLIDQHAISLPSTEVYVMFSRASVDEEFVEQFNDALQVLVEDGYIEHVISRYSIY